VSQLLQLRLGQPVRLVEGELLLVVGPVPAADEIGSVAGVALCGSRAGRSVPGMAAVDPATAGLAATAPPAPIERRAITATITERVRTRRIGSITADPISSLSVEGVGRWRHGAARGGGDF